MSKKPGKTPTPRDYHLILADNTERNVTADEVMVLDGVLQLCRADGAVKVAYAEGHWRSVELETQDDRG